LIINFRGTKMPNNIPESKEPELKQLYEINNEVRELEERYDLKLIEKFKALHEEFSNSASTLNLSSLATFNQKRSNIITETKKELEDELEPLQAKVEALDLSKVTQLIAAANSPRARDLPDYDLNQSAQAGVQAGVQRSTFKHMDIFKNEDQAPNRRPRRSQDVAQNLDQNKAREFLNQFKLQNVPRLKISLPKPRPGNKPRLTATPSLRPY